MRVRKTKAEASSNPKAGRARGLHRFTVKELQALGPGWHCDGGGLYVLIGPGSASWVYRYGNGKNMGLGSVSVVSLAEARDLAHACRQLRAAGIDPKAKRDTERAAAKITAAKAVSFDQCVAAYIQTHAPGWRNPKHRQQWQNTLASYASPVIGALPIGAVDVGLVLQILEPIWSTKPETAGRLRGRIEVIIDWAKARGYRDGENPARWRGHLDKLLPPRAKVHRVQHHPALGYAELPTFMAALRERPGMAARALEFTILTAARSGETRGATFAEIDLAAKLWTIPADRMKADREHRVPLSPRALEIVGELATEARKRSPDIGTMPIFHGARWTRPLSNMSLTAVLRRMKLDVVPHGFRSTFKTWASERTNFQREVVEAALAHVTGDKVEAAYQRGDLFDKRRRLMNAWASFTATALTTADVIPIGRVS